MSIPTNPDSVTGLDLLMDAVGYGAVAGLAQTVSHKVFAKKQLPETWEELVTRYVAGSTVNAAACTAWVIHRHLRRVPTSAAEAAAMHWLILGASGLVVAGLHYFDHQIARAAHEIGRQQGADELRRQYEEREKSNGRVTSFERLHGRTGA